jgi:hypothetical protein
LTPPLFDGTLARFLNSEKDFNTELTENDGAHGGSHRTGGALAEPQTSREIHTKQRNRTATNVLQNRTSSVTCVYSVTSV